MHRSIVWEVTQKSLSQFGGWWDLEDFQIGIEISCEVEDKLESLEGET